MEGDKVEVEFPTKGKRTLVARITDDKGEVREKSFTVYVVSPATPWLIIGSLLLASILAIFYLFSYSKRRRLLKR